MLADTLRALEGRPLKNGDGTERRLRLLPPASEAEIKTLEQGLPCPLAEEVRAALKVSKGLANGPTESWSLMDLGGFGLEEMLPYAYAIAHDGYGNYWVLDVLPGQPAWAPVFYACHDPPVLAYQSASIEEFLLATVAIEEGGPRSTVDVVHEEVVHQVWRDNPGLMPATALTTSPDPELQAFAVALPSGAHVADLRHAKVGDGLNWGRFGPKTIIRRAGHARIWAVIPPPRRPGLLARLFGGG